MTGFLSPGPPTRVGPKMGSPAPLKTFDFSFFWEIQKKALFELLRGPCLRVLHFRVKEPRTARGHCADPYIKKWSIGADPGGAYFGLFWGSP